MVVFYDIGFIIQHYCLYPQSREKLVVADKYSKLSVSNENITMNQTLMNIEKKNQEDEVEKIVPSKSKWSIVLNCILVK